MPGLFIALRLARHSHGSFGAATFRPIVALQFTGPPNHINAPDFGRLAIEPLRFPVAPRAVAIVKLSALGDVFHTLPVIRTLQRTWPDTRFTWVIGRTEAKLIGKIPDIEFIEFDKRGGRGAYAALHKTFRGRSFDLLLHMQFAWRASLVAAMIKAEIKLGYDRARALDLQWMFTTHRIAAVPRQHVMDSLFEFARSVGVESRTYCWDVPVPESARDYAQRAIPDHVPTLIISPCSSHSVRNWNIAGYAKAGDYAVRELGLKVLICGGPTDLELRTGAAIASAMREPCVNQVGKDTLPEFYAALGRARVILTPDSGPAHMATALGVPVVGLYASTNPARSGPYFSLDLCCDQFDAAARRFLGKPAAELPWRTKIAVPGVMDLIDPSEVTRKLAEALQPRPKLNPV